MHAREGLESGDAVWYAYPHEESETVRAELRKYGINVEKHEKDGTLHMKSQTEFFMPNGKLDYKQAVDYALDWWAEAKRKGYKHARGIEDFGDFSFADGRWQEYVTEYWYDPRWDDPKASEWVLSTVSPDQQLGTVMVPFVMDITAINVEHMPKTQVNELVKALTGESFVPEFAFIDLFGFMNSFSGSIGLDHGRLIGRKILLEYDPVSNYERIVDSLAKESMANVESILVFTQSTSPIRKHLAGQPAIKFFLTSFSTSTPKTSSENEMLLPAKNTPLILETLSKVLETYPNVNVCFVFDILSELLMSIGLEKTFIFLRHALDMLSSEKLTCLFLLNSSAHEPQVVSQLKSLFSNQLTYDKNGLEIVRTF